MSPLPRRGSLTKYQSKASCFYKDVKNILLAQKRAWFGAIWKGGDVWCCDIGHFQTALRPAHVDNEHKIL